MLTWNMRVCCKQAHIHPTNTTPWVVELNSVAHVSRVVYLNAVNNRGCSYQTPVVGFRLRTFLFRQSIRYVF